MSIEVNDARQQAVWKLEGIKEMMGRLAHSDECDGDEDSCDSSFIRKEIISQVGVEDEEYQLLWEHPELDFDSYHNHDAALKAITESPLSVEVRSSWVPVGQSMDDPGAAEYCILLCTGGPAVRIVGELGRYSEPETARIEYQDWGTPWTEMGNTAELSMTYSEMETTLMAYARQFWFGE